MLTLATWLFNATVALLWVALGANLLLLWHKHRLLRTVATAGSWAAWLVLAASMVFRGVALGYFPFLTLFDTISVLGWVTLGVLLILQSKFNWPVLGLLVLAIISLIMTYATQVPQTAQPLPELFQSPWFVVHVALNFLSYGAFAVSFVLSALYLWQERQLKRKQVNFWYYKLPSLDKLEYLSDLLVRMAFPLLTLGIITGAFYAENAWGSYWDWNAKETWSLITWFVYAGYLHARHIQGWRGRRAIILSLIGFLAVLFNYFGVSLFIKSPHSFLRIL